MHHSFVKSPVFPFQKFPGADTILGPEMKSTGEVMGVADSFGLAFAKAQLAARNRIPISGRIFISVNDHDKPLVIPIARELAELGFKLVATRGTSQALRASGIPVERVFKVAERRPSIVDLVKSAAIDLIINTPLGRSSRQDDRRDPPRRSSTRRHVHYDSVRCRSGDRRDSGIEKRAGVGGKLAGVASERIDRGPASRRASAPFSLKADG